MNNDTKYEKNISLITILEAIKRQVFSILYFTLVFAVCGLIFCNFIDKKQYKSTIMISNTYSISSTLITNITEKINMDETLSYVTDKLQKGEIFHSNGNLISNSEIKNGLLIPTTVNASFYMKISFVNVDKKILQPVLNTLMEYVTKELNAQFSDTFYLSISSQASDPINISNSNKNLLMFIAFGLLLGLAVAIIVDIKMDRIYSKKDTENYAERVFCITLKEKNRQFLHLFKKSSNFNSLIDSAQNNQNALNSLIELQNEINIYGNSKIIGIISPNDTSLSSFIGTLLGKTYASFKESTVIIDCSFSNGKSLKDLFNNQIENYKDLNELLDEKTTFEDMICSLSETLSLSFSTYDAYPTKIFLSEKFDEFIKNCEKKFQHIIMIIPNANQSSSFLLFKKFLGSILLASKKDTTKREDIYTLVNNLKNNKLPYVGTTFLNLK